MFCVLPLVNPLYSLLDVKDVIIPAPYMGLVRETVLVEEYIECESMLKVRIGYFNLQDYLFIR